MNRWTSSLHLPPESPIFGDTTLNIDPKWLEPTWFIDSDSKTVRRFADAACGDAKDPVDMASALFHAIRDEIRYNP